MLTFRALDLSWHPSFVSPLVELSILIREIRNRQCSLLMRPPLELMVPLGPTVVRARCRLVLVMQTRVPVLREELTLPVAWVRLRIPPILRWTAWSRS